jgi:hypothetical protein
MIVVVIITANAQPGDPERLLIATVFDVTQFQCRLRTFFTRRAASSAGQYFVNRIKSQRHATLMHGSSSPTSIARGTRSLIDTLSLILIKSRSHFLTHLTTNVAVQLFALLIRNLEVPSSTANLQTGYPNSD